MNRVEQEVARKNASLHKLNREGSKVYQYYAPGTPGPQVIAREKYAASVSGEAPKEMSVDENQAWTKRDWWLTAAVAAGCVLVFFALVKYKIIKI